MKSVEEVFSGVQHLLPHGAVLVSGGLVDANGTSDVDVLVMTNEPGEVRWSLHGYDRVVNVLVTDNKDRLRALIHREVELELEAKFPALAASAWIAKQSGLKTEAAWANILQLEGCPYAAMADRTTVMKAAKSLS